jgi:hypothetical protein
MNLNSIVAGAIGAVNPDITITIQASTGYSTNADGTRAPAYAAPVSMQGQVQALQYNDIAQIDGLNITGTRRKLYINGAWNGVVRADGKGGDLVTLPDSSVWLVVFVFEQWADWAAVCITEQDGS